MDDRQLQREYVASRSHDAFRRLVERHLPMVYSAARRIVRDPQLAEEVAQSVFTTLAQKAALVQPPQVLGGWLYNTTRHLSMKAVRDEQRRRDREQTAAALHLLDSIPEAPQVSEHLEPAMADLQDDDRDAVVLRYMEDRSLREVGAELGISEDAARMRVNRALDRLRAGFARRGVTVTPAVLATAITSSTVATAASLGSAITTTALASLGISATVAAGAAPGFVNFIAGISKRKLAAGIVTSILLSVVVFNVLRTQNRMGRVGLVEVAQSAGAAPTPDQQAALSRIQEATDATEVEPDPLQLLQAVAKARQRIASGSMRFEVSTERVEGKRKHTMQVPLALVFEGEKLRSEQSVREYSYVGVGSEASEAAAAKIKEQDLDQEGAVRAGLLKGFEARVVTVYDGTVLMAYRENDGKSVSVQITDPNHGSSSFIFDPRCLGLSTSNLARNSVEDCLGYREAKAIRLVGKEPIEGVPAWHVSVQTKYDELLDFWIDAAHPTRLLQHTKGSNGSNRVVSKFDNAAPANSIPIEVATTEYRNGSLSYASHFKRTETQINVPMDPATFTLSGLGMAVGSTVTDVRNQRNIGFWTGTGLSEDLPKGDSSPDGDNAPRLNELMSLLEHDTSSEFALNSATWILLNTPDGPEVEKVAEIVLEKHSQNPSLTSLCKGLERVRHRCSKLLLAAILKENPDAAVRAEACFVLATLLKDEANFGLNKPATVEAEKHFARIITEFSSLGARGADLARLAKPELHELRNLIIGKPAPDTTGEDLNGETLNLRDYRGKVVVLLFWTVSHDFLTVEYRKAIERMDRTTFTVIGVNCNENLAKAKTFVEEHSITWPSYWDKRGGPIYTSWNVNGWPTVFVLDKRGVIRYRDVRERDLVAAVDTLLHE